MMAVSEVFGLQGNIAVATGGARGIGPGTPSLIVDGGLLAQ